MFASNQDRFLLDINGDTGCRVLAFTGNETMDHPYEFNVTFISIEPQSMEELLQKPVCLTLLPVHEYDAAGQETKQRHIHGMILACRQEEMSCNQYQYQYTLTLAPRLSLLAYNNRYRIFQQMSVPEIVRQILKEAGIADFDPRLHEQHLTREYCVQYNESDLAFVKRILSEEGIHFHFEHSKEAHTLVIQDTLSGLAKSTPVMFRPHSGQVAECAVLQKWQVHRKVSSGVSSGRGMDFTRPHWIESTAEFSHNDTRQTRTVLRHDTWPLPVNEDEKVLKQASRRHMESLERLQHTATGTTDSTDCQPGTWLPVSEHPDEKSNGEWFVCAVEHKARQPGAKEELADPNEISHYEATVQATHNHFNWRPEKIDKPPVRGVLSAVVTGAADNEIYTDEYGRIKIQFPWDREGKGNENSSAWLRVAQQWAGKGYGSFSLPRVGHEVIVEFLNADIDQPLVTGSLYNGDNMPPHALPDHQTRSGIKTLSSPGGKTDNEIRFEDKAGSEQIYLHAGKDLATQVDNDQHVVVEKDHHHTTKSNHYQHTQGEHHTTVEKDLLHTVQGNTHSRTEGSVQEKTGANHLLQAGQVLHVKAGEHLVIEGGESLSVQAGGQFLTINSGGVFASKKVETGGAPGMAPPPSPQSATLPGGIDLAGIGQVPVGIGGMGTGKPGDPDSQSGQEQQKEEEKEEQIEGIALYPLRYALVEGKASDPSLAPESVVPSFKTTVKPVGVRLARPGFVYVCHSESPDILLGYSLTAVAGQSPECKRIGVWKLAEDAEKPTVQPVNDFATEDDALLSLQGSDPAASTAVVVPRRGSICIAYLPDLGETMTEKKIGQWLVTSWAERCHLMQEVSISGFDSTYGSRDLIPLPPAGQASLADVVVTECRNHLPAPDEEQAKYLDTLETVDTKKPFFWSEHPCTLLEGGSKSLQTPFSGSNAKDNALLLMHDDAGVIKDLVNYQNLVILARENWGKKKEDATNSHYTNAYRYEEGGMILAMVNMIPADINKALQDIGYTFFPNETSREMIGRWAHAWFMHATLTGKGGMAASQKVYESMLQESAKRMRAQGYPEEQIERSMELGRTKWDGAPLEQAKSHLAANESAMEKNFGTHWPALKKVIIDSIALDEPFSESGLKQKLPQQPLSREQKNDLLRFAQTCKKTQETEEAESVAGSVQAYNASIKNFNAFDQERLTRLQEQERAGKQSLASLESSLEGALKIFWPPVKARLLEDINQKQQNENGALLNPAPSIRDEIRLDELKTFMKEADAREGAWQQLTERLVDDRIQALTAFDFKAVILYDKNTVTQYHAGLRDAVIALNGLKASEAGINFMAVRYFQQRGYFARLRWPFESYQALPDDDTSLKKNLTDWYSKFRGNLKTLKQAMSLGSDLRQTLSNITNYARTVENTEAMLSACLDPGRARTIAQLQNKSESLSLEARYNRLVMAPEWPGMREEIQFEQLRYNVQIVLADANDVMSFDRNLKQTTSKLYGYTIAKANLNSFWLIRERMGHYDGSLLNDPDRLTLQRLERTMNEAREELMQATTRIVQATEPVTGNAGLKIIGVDGTDLTGITHEMNSLKEGVRKGFGGYASGYSVKDEVLEQAKKYKDLPQKISFAGNLIPLVSAWNAAVGLKDLKEEDPEWYRWSEVGAHVSNLLASIGSIAYEARRSRLEKAFYAFQETMERDAGHFATALGRFTVRGSTMLSGLNLVAMLGNDLTDGRNIWNAFEEGNPRAGFGALLQEVGETGQSAIFTRQLVAGMIRWRAAARATATEGAWITGGAELGEILAGSNLLLLGFIVLAFVGEWIYKHYNPEPFMAWLNHSSWGRHEKSDWSEHLAKTRLAEALQAPQLHVKGANSFKRILAAIGHEKTRWNPKVDTLSEEHSQSYLAEEAHLTLILPECHLAQCTPKQTPTITVLAESSEEDVFISKARWEVVTENMLPEMAITENEKGLALHFMPPRLNRYRHEVGRYRFIKTLAVIVSYQPPLADAPLKEGMWGWQLKKEDLAGGDYLPKPEESKKLRELIKKHPAKPQPLTRLIARTLTTPSEEARS